MDESLALGVIAEQLGVPVDILIYNKSCIIFLHKWHILCFSKEC